jgi:hypothetical protein
VLFDNCGIDGDEFAEILKGLQQLKDVKSIVYKLNQINQKSIDNLLPILDKRLPNHLAELKLIDCNVHPLMIEQLMNKLIDKSQLKSLSIVNVQLSEPSLDKII